MRRKSFAYWQMRLFVKSPLIYYSYLALFVAVFLYYSSTIQLDIRSTYSGVIDSGVVQIQTYECIDYLGSTVYLFENRNERIIPFEIIDSDYSNGVFSLYIGEKHFFPEGNIQVEMTVGYQSLLEKIFTRAGST